VIQKEDIKLRHEIVEAQIEAWHNGVSNKELHEYLGWTWAQYSKHVLDPTYLPPKTENNF
jgi:hypothetical protein